MARNQPIKVAFCLDSFAIGGTELNAVRTAEAFDPAKVELSIFHLRDDGPLRARYEKLGVPMAHVPIPNLRSFRTLSQGLHLAKVLRVGRFEVVHSHDIYCNIFAVPFARMLTSSAVIASRRWWFEAPRPELVTLNRLCNRFAHRVLANSTGVAQLLEHSEAVSAAKIAMIPNFLSPSAFDVVAIEARLAQRRSWGIPDGAFVVGIVARLSPVKNHQMLVRAIATLPTNVHLLIIGDGPERPSLESLVAQLGIETRTHLTGEVVSEFNLHQFADVSVLCSISEGFPNTVIEAMAARRAVVATPVGGIGDAIVDGETGFVVPHNDVARLAKAIGMLSLDTRLRTRIGDAAVAAARLRFSQDTVLAMLVSLYESLSVPPRYVPYEAGRA